MAAGLDVVLVGDEAVLAPLVDRSEQDLDQRLAGYIVDGSRTGLIEDLDRKRSEGAAPLDIINGPLMAGMSEVGRLFNDNELIVAEVLQSAEVMKAAIRQLEPHLDLRSHTTEEYSIRWQRTHPTNEKRRPGMVPTAGLPVGQKH